MRNCVVEGRGEIVLLLFKTNFIELTNYRPLSYKAE